MFRKIVLAVIVAMASAALTGCSTGQLSSDRAHEEVVTALISGSAESPDPILLRVRELERQGVLTNVIVMESFPVQMKVTGPRGVIIELESIPRKKLSDFQ